MTNTYSHLAVEASLCLWEAINELTLTRRNVAKAADLRAARESFGTNELRQWCIHHGQWASDVWHALPEDDRDMMSFDWEFCPAIILDCVAWSPYQLPTAHSVEAATAAMRAELQTYVDAAK
jgi:hypothetical protein